ncbi:glutathione S-transferase family protein [Novosphingobium flavum]|uniref:Glutathione S-transferase family protein n=1 Tax=Novosphingobium aerophilum TaxID=2839843 RepID=A0A7X1FBS0_9SPHN|nr:MULTISPECIES: glutathione S-transferase family protein [Novosphingobium]MBC2653639.1 glutathione S-transferase family protein [Novosphingobium aerophilum]MBC2663400.1 glutathione S-transferase family protein [Novosphingobium aerophilum]
MAEYTFFTHPMSRGQIARWALHEAGADYEQVLVNWQDKPAALLAANPMGKVPTLIHHALDGDRVITECAAICAYLAEAQPGAELAPHDSERADYVRWLFFAAGPVEHAVTTRAMGFEPPADKQGMLGFGSFERTIDTLETLFADSRPWVCGDHFTMADVYIGSQIDWGLTFGTMPPRVAFVAYAERLQARDAYKAAKAIDQALIADMQK